MVRYLDADEGWDAVRVDSDAGARRKFFSIVDRLRANPW
jgi:hypothetical protein